MDKYILTVIYVHLIWLLDKGGEAWLWVEGGRLSGGRAKKKHKIYYWASCCPARTRTAKRPGLAQRARLLTHTQSVLFNLQSLRRVRKRRRRGENTLERSRMERPRFASRRFVSFHFVSFAATTSFSTEEHACERDGHTKNNANAHTHYIHKYLTVNPLRSLRAALKKKYEKRKAETIKNISQISIDKSDRHHR